MESSPPSSQPRPILFRLSRKLRDDIYRRVLVVPHPLHLFADGGARKVQLFAPGRPAQHWLALLSTNRKIRNEASTTLYGAHQFVLVDTSRRQVILLESFLGSIRSVKGSVNVDHLRHLCINFPGVDKRSGGGSGEAEGSLLWKEDLRGLKLLREMCGNLATLVTHVHDKNSRGLVVPRGEGDLMLLEDTKAALAEVEARFKGIASLKRVVVRLYDGRLKPEVDELMRSFGWVVAQGR